MENTTSNADRQEKFTLIDTFITAMFMPKEYNKLFHLSKWKIVRYVAILVLFVSIIQYVIPTLGAIAGMGGLKNIIMNDIPEFALEKGCFYYEERLETVDEAAGVYVLVDTSVEKFTKDDIPKDMYQSVLVSKNNMIVSNAVYGMVGMYDELPFGLWKDITITNATVADMSGMLYLCLGIAFVVLYGITAVQYLGMALFFAVIMYLFTKVITPGATFGTMYVATIFAQSIGVIVESVAYCIGSEMLIMAGSAFNVIVTVILMNRAMASYRIGPEEV